MKPVYLLLGLSFIALFSAGCSSSEQPVPSTPTPDLEATVEATNAITDEAEKKEDVSSAPTLPPTNDKHLTLDPRQIIIERIIDGDTIEVQLSTGLKETVRLIGVDTPETSKSNSSDEYEGVTDVACLDTWGTKATEFTKTYLLGGKQHDQSVVLESDSLTDERGYYDRLLAYVIVDNVDFNSVLVKNGYARVYIEKPFSRVGEYLLLQKSARDNNLGLWSCKTKTPMATPTTTPPGSSQDSANLKCDPSYPDVCIPPYPPDLDCGEIPYRRFTVLPPDRHRFDGDKDGIGCES